MSKEVIESLINEMINDISIDKFASAKDKLMEIVDLKISSRIAESAIEHLDIDVPELEEGNLESEYSEEYASEEEYLDDFEKELLEMEDFDDEDLEEDFDDEIDDDFEIEE
jgi:hypothetical protein